MSDTVTRTPIRCASNIIGREQFEDDEFLHTMAHLLDDESKPLCGCEFDVSAYERGGEYPTMYLGEMIHRDTITRNTGEDEFCGTCHNCIRVAKARIGGGWLPVVSTAADCLTRENCYF